MRTLLVTVALLLVSAATASAQWVVPRTTTKQPAPAIPKGIVAVKTVALLPGGSYPWVQPTWARVHGVLIARLPAPLLGPSVNPH